MTNQPRFLQMGLVLTARHCDQSMALIYENKRAWHWRCDKCGADFKRSKKHA